MAKYDAIVPAFNGGEWSGRMRGRHDLEAYRRACALVRNVEPFVQGSARKRPGTKYLRNLPDADSTVRLGVLRTARAGDFGFVLTDQQLDVYDAAGAAVSDGALETVLNGTFDAAGAYWTSTGINFTSGRATVSAFNGVLRQAVSGFVAEDLTFKISCDFSGEFAEVTVNLGTTLDGTELASQVLVPGTTEIALTAVTGTVYIQVVLLSVFSGWVDDISLMTAGTGAVSFATPWAPGDLGEVQWAEDTGGDRIIFVHSKYEPRILARSVSGVWSFTTPTWTSKPGTWTGSNWPAAVEVHQGRLWLAAPPDAPTTFWGSKSGSYFDFTIGTNPGDAFSYIAATKNAIRWMRGHRVMMMGAANAELAVTAASVIVGPGDVDVREESAYGSAPAMALKAGNEVLYVTGDRTKIRAIRYDFQNAGWVSDDITDVAEHLFAGGIDELHYGRDPNHAVVAVLKSGELRVCTYVPTQKVAAWWRWDTLPGVVYSAAVLYQDGGAYLWVAVGGRQAAVVDLEALPLGEPADVQYLDAHVVRPVSARTVTGLAHFGGQTVEVVLDGAYGGTAVQAAGELQVSRDGAVAVVGLPYTSKLQPLPVEGGNPAGTAQGLRKRRSEISVRLNDSALPLINGWRPREQRDPARPMDFPPARFTGDVKVSDRGITDDGEVVIEMDRPFRTEVCAIFGPVQQDGV